MHQMKEAEQPVAPSKEFGNLMPPFFVNVSIIFLSVPRCYEWPLGLVSGLRPGVCFWPLLCPCKSFPLSCLPLQSIIPASQVPYKDCMESSLHYLLVSDDGREGGKFSRQDRGRYRLPPAFMGRHFMSYAIINNRIKQSLLTAGNGWYSPLSFSSQSFILPS